MSDVEQQRVVEDFGNAQRPVRLLICSDVASEGINLHYQCHRLIHFDPPWSLMVFQQRNGRVDRYGQTATPRIVYLVTESANPTIRGDTRILEVLMEKDEQAYRNIGDPSVFMDVHDVHEEERITERAIAHGEAAADFDRRLTPKPNEGESLLAMFLHPEGSGDGRDGDGGGARHGGAGTAAEETGTRSGEPDMRPGTAPPPPTPTLLSPLPPLSLFESELAYCEAALHRLQARRGHAGGGDGVADGSGGGSAAAPARLRFRVDAESETLTLDAPDDLTARYRYLPPEILPDSRRFVLTTDRLRMAEAIEESRRAETAWPRMHYLWRLSPVVGWLNDRVPARVRQLAGGRAASGGPTCFRAVEGRSLGCTGVGQRYRNALPAAPRSSARTRGRSWCIR